MASRDCLSLSDGEYAVRVEPVKARKTVTKKKPPRKTASRKRPSKSADEGSKKRRDEQPLTVGDLPTIVKAVVEALPGSSSGRKVSDGRDDCESSQFEEGTLNELYIRRYSIPVSRDSAILRLRSR